jgi:Transposase
MIDRHWDGIAAYCKPETKVSLGFVEGLNNKIRVIQRRAYACAMKSTFNSKSSPACYQCSDASPSFWVRIRPHDFTKSPNFRRRRRTTLRQSPVPRSRRRRLLLHPMVDAVQPYNTNYDKVDGNNVIQQPWNKKD